MGKNLYNAFFVQNGGLNFLDVIGQAFMTEATVEVTCEFEPAVVPLPAAENPAFKAKLKKLLRLIQITNNPV